jgi:hypothetical protein
LFLFGADIRRRPDELGVSAAIELGDETAQRQRQSHHELKLPGSGKPDDDGPPGHV